MELHSKHTGNTVIFLYSEAQYSVCLSLLEYKRDLESCQELRNNTVFEVLLKLSTLLFLVFFFFVFCSKLRQQLA